jgi:excisionase family DNA binding protein
MPTVQEFEQWLTPQQVADQTGISKQAIHKQLNNHKLRSARTHQGVLIDPAEVEKIKARRSSAGRGRARS